jgi:RimJ/RimL family protein N-acetyltransferase
LSIAARLDDSVITTPRLIVRPLAVDDADEMVHVLADPVLHEFTGGAPLSLDELRARYERWSCGSGSDDEAWLNWIVIRAEDSVAVGTLQATVVRSVDGHTAYIAWTIGVEWQGQGFAVEAATALVKRSMDCDVTSVVAHVHPDHHASAAVARRAGLRRTSDMVDGEMVWRLEANVL